MEKKIICPHCKEEVFAVDGVCECCAEEIILEKEDIAKVENKKFLCPHCGENTPENENLCQVCSEEINTEKIQKPEIIKEIDFNRLYGGEIINLITENFSKLPEF